MTRRWPIVPCALLLAAAAPPAAPPSAPPSPQSLLDQARIASGGPALAALAITHAAGTVTVGGLSGKFDQWLDWPGVRQSQSYNLGPASGRQGWNGTLAWSVDPSGQVRTESSASAIAAAIGSAYMAVEAALLPGRYPAAIEPEGRRTLDDAEYDVLKITPQKSDPVELWLDARTHLPARTVDLTGAQPQTTLLSDYRDLAGARIPFHVQVRIGADPKYDTVAQIDTIAAAAAPAGIFDPPAAPGYDAQFPKGANTVTLRFRLLNNHIYLPVSIDQRPAQPFIFDTGATNFLDASHAAALGLKPQGALPGGGFGDKISAVGLVKVASVEAGGMVLHDQIFATNDLAGLRAVEGIDFAGLIGYEFTKRAVTTIDYAAHRITFTRPDAFHPPAGVTPVPFTFAAHIPMVAATLDGVPGQFEIDTGSRGALTLMHPFVQAHDLVAQYKPRVTATVGYGVGARPARRSPMPARSPSAPSASPPR